jgi:hypothetical protein
VTFDLTDAKQQELERYAVLALQNRQTALTKRHDQPRIIYFATTPKLNQRSTPDRVALINCGIYPRNFL